MRVSISESWWQNDTLNSSRDVVVSGCWGCRKHVVGFCIGNDGHSLLLCWRQGARHLGGRMGRAEIKT